MPDDVKVVSAKVDGLDLVVSTESEAQERQEERFHVRQLTNFEIRHDPESREDVRVFVGYSDPETKTLFVPRAMSKKFIGRVRTGGKLNRIRKTFARVGVPIIEF